jgi:hypothetical protein
MLVVIQQVVDDLNEKLTVCLKQTIIELLFFVLFKGIYHPNVQYATYYHSPSFFHRSMDHGFGRDAFVEKYGKN